MTHSIVFSFLITLASYVGVELSPYGEAHWGTPNWEMVDSHYHLSLESNTLAQECTGKPDEYVDFPVALISIQKVWLDGKLFLQTGGPSLKYVRNWVGQPVISCQDLVGVKNVKWEVETSNKAFAQIQYLPYVTKNFPRTGEISSAINIIGAGVAFILAVISLVLFKKNTSLRERVSIFVATFSGAIYSAAIANGMTGIWIETPKLHKLALSCAWIAVFSMVNLYWIEGYIKKWPQRLYLTNLIVGLAVILLGRNPDETQVGSLVMFPGTFLILGYMLFSLFMNAKLRVQKGPLRLFYIACPAFFCLGMAIEMLAVLRVFNGPPIFPLGIVTGLLFFILALIEKINETYSERDYLRKNLESEVEKKTAEVASTLRELLKTQAKLVQNAKLASVGTLAAGLSHEINNALNFMSGATSQLKAILNECVPPARAQETKEVVSVLESGLNISTNVVRSLQSHTGINQAKFKEMNLKAVVEDTINLVKSRMEKVILDIKIPSEIKVYGSVSGFNQIIMNLILNSVDAMNGGPGKISISAKKVIRDQIPSVELIITDTGCGISSEIIEHIFDPFYTTKDVGKGSGLGLYIVKNEVENHSGSIDVESEKGQGTKFTVIVPLEAKVKVA